MQGRQTNRPRRESCQDVVPPSIRRPFLISNLPSLRRRSRGENIIVVLPLDHRGFWPRPGVEPGPTMPCSSSCIRRRCPSWRQSLTRVSRFTFEGEPGTGVEPALPCTPIGIRQSRFEEADKTNGETQHFSRCSPFRHSAPSFFTVRLLRCERSGGAFAARPPLQSLVSRSGLEPESERS